MTTVHIENLHKAFGNKELFRGLDLTFREHQVVGLIGLNGSGKTTLLRHLTGMYLPDKGQIQVFGCPTKDLGQRELARIGVVHQENRFLEWMTIQQQIRYVSGFYEAWDPALEYKLMTDFRLKPEAKVGALSPGDVQKLAVLLAVCHKPEFLILDEPASAMDPLSRRKFLELLFSLMEHQFKTVVVSSHVLTDIEKLVNHIVCLKDGQLCLDLGLDELYERFEEWIVSSREGRLPDQFHDRAIIHQQGDRHQMRLRLDRNLGGDLVEQPGTLTEQGFNVRREALNLEKIFPILIGEGS